MHDRERQIQTGLCGESMGARSTNLPSPNACWFLPDNSKLTLFPSFILLCFIYLCLLWPSPSPHPSCPFTVGNSIPAGREIITQVERHSLSALDTKTSSTYLYIFFILDGDLNHQQQKNKGIRSYKQFSVPNTLIVHGCLSFTFFSF